MLSFASAVKNKSRLPNPTQKRAVAVCFLST